jgi:hypothetical protein
MALAFGLGGRDVASRMLPDAYNRGRTNTGRFRRDTPPNATARAPRRPCPHEPNPTQARCLSAPDPPTRTHHAAASLPLTRARPGRHPNGRRIGAAGPGGSSAIADQHLSAPASS